MKIGNILRQRRKMLGRTLEDIAFVADTDAGNLSRIERDEQRPSLDLLESIVSALGITMSALFANAEQYVIPELTEQQPDYNVQQEMEAQLAQLIKHYYSLNKDGRELAMNLVHALRKTHGETRQK